MSCGPTVNRRTYRSAYAYSSGYREDIETPHIYRGFRVFFSKTTYEKGNGVASIYPFGIMLKGWSG